VASLLGKSKAPSSISASMVSSTSVGTLMKYDQLDGLRKTKMFPLISFEEGKITFPPTFKYDIGRDIFDSSKKRRCPAWTDRILFQQVPDTANLERIVDDPSNKNTVSPNKGEMLKLLKYDSIRNCRHSDHRPVVATFSVTPST
jgi:phosphatidylinositol-bisphosphatase